MKGPNVFLALKRILILVPVLLLLFLNQDACETGGTREISGTEQEDSIAEKTEELQKEALRAYSELLHREEFLNEKKSEEKPCFALCDLEADGVSELIVSEERSELASKFYYYTYENGQVAQAAEAEGVDLYPKFGALYCMPSRGTYAFFRGGPPFDDEEGNGCMPYLILEFELKDHTVRQVNEAYREEYQFGKRAGENEYYLNEKECTQEEYESIYGAFGDEIVFVPNSKENREKWGVDH